jgi:hypothetical protein
VRSRLVHFLRCIDSLLYLVHIRFVLQPDSLAFVLGEVLLE